MKLSKKAGLSYILSNTVLQFIHRRDRPFIILRIGWMPDITPLTVMLLALCSLEASLTEWTFAWSIVGVSLCRGTHPFLSLLSISYFPPYYYRLTDGVS